MAAARSVEAEPASIEGVGRAVGGSQHAAEGLGTLPPERQLTVADLRRVERQRRLGPELQPRAPMDEVRCPVPAAGDPRRRWLRQRLVALIQEEMLPCPAEQGVPAVGVLELFEQVTGEAFSDTPGVLVGSRVRGIAKVLGNVAREEPWDPPLRQTARRGLVFWNRRPRQPRDAAAWRLAVEASEAHTAPIPRLRDQMAAADIGLVPWLKGHRYLMPTAVESGESGMALLLLWEVDHQQAYPSTGGPGLAGALLGFSKRLQERAKHDVEVSQWLCWKDMATPLSAGLAPSHHRRWSVRIAAPGADEPQGWYEEFVARWRAYLETMARPSGPGPGALLAEQMARIRPAAVDAVPAAPAPATRARRPAVRAVPEADVGEAPAAPARKRARVVPSATLSRKRLRPEGGQVEAPVVQRQRTLMGWVQAPRSAPSPQRHGRATEGPLT